MTGCGCCIHCQCTGRCVVDRRDEKQDFKEGAGNPSRYNTKDSSEDIENQFHEQKQEICHNLTTSLPHPNDLIRARKSSRTPMLQTSDILTPMVFNESSSLRNQQQQALKPLIASRNASKSSQATEEKSNYLNASNHSSRTSSRNQSRSTSRRSSLERKPVKSLEVVNQVEEAANSEQFLKIPKVQESKEVSPTSSLERKKSKRNLQSDVTIRTWAPTPTLGSFNNPKYEREEADSGANSISPLPPKISSKKNTPIQTPIRSPTPSKGFESDYESDEDFNEALLAKLLQQKKEKELARQKRRKEREEAKREQEILKQKHLEKQERKHEKEERAALALKRQASIKRDRGKDFDSDNEKSNSDEEQNVKLKSVQESKQRNLSRSPVVEQTIEQRPITPIPSPGNQEDNGMIESKSISIGGITLTRTKTRNAKERNKSVKDQSLVNGFEEKGISRQSSLKRSQSRTNLDHFSSSDVNGDSKRERVKNYIDNVVKEAKESRDRQVAMKVAANVQKAKLSKPPPGSMIDGRGNPLHSIHASVKLIVQHSTMMPNTIYYIDMSRMDEEGNPFCLFRLQVAPGWENSIPISEHSNKKEKKRKDQLKDALISSHETGSKLPGKLLIGEGRYGPAIFWIDVKRRAVDRFVINGASGEYSSFSDNLHWGAHEDYRHLYCQSPKGQQLKWFIQEPNKLMRLYGRGKDDHGHVYAEARLTQSNSINSNGSSIGKRSNPTKEAALQFFSQKDSDFDQHLLAYLCATWWCARQTYDEGQIAVAHAEVEMIENIESAFEMDLLGGA